MHVTVCICTRNRGDSIAMALRSILVANYADFDVVIVDQSSSDETAEAVRRVAGDDPRVTYIRSDTVGSGVAHNISMANARGPIVSFTDDDCEVCPDRMRLFARYFANNPDVGLIFGAVYAGPHDAGAGFVPDYPVPRFRRVTSPWLKWRERGIGANMAFRKEVLERVGSFDEVLGPGAPLHACLDGDMTYRVLKAGYSVLNVPDAYVVHHGFRAWGEGQKMMRRVGLGVGAAYMKHLRLGDPAVLPTLVVEAARCISWKRLFLLRWRHLGLARFYGYLKGMVQSYHYPIDPQHRTYIPSPKLNDLRVCLVGKDKKTMPRRPDTHTRAPKVLLLTTTAEIGGTERIAVSLSREFTARGWRMHTVFPQQPGSAALLKWCHNQNVDAEANPVVLPVTVPHSFRNMLALRRFVRRNNPDVINIHYGSSFISLKDIIAIRLAGRYRCVATVNHPAGDDIRKRIMTNVAARLCHGIVVISHATQERLLAAGVPQDKIHLIPCGSPVPRHIPTRAEAQARLNIPASAFVISSLARLTPSKGIAALIEAARRLPDPESQIIVVIAGDGPERATLENLASARLNGRARFLGRVPDTADVYSAADIFVLASAMEGFGLVYVEAAFYGIPSIGTNAGGAPDAIADGETGLLVPSGDIAALTAAIDRLHHDTDLRLRLGRAACLRANSEFTEEHMADRYAKIYKTQSSHE